MAMYPVEQSTNPIPPSNRSNGKPEHELEVLRVCHFNIVSPDQNNLYHPAESEADAGADHSFHHTLSSGLHHCSP